MIVRTLACTVPRRELARRAVAAMGDAAVLVAASTISGITFTAAAAYAHRRVRDMTLTTCWIRLLRETFAVVCQPLTPCDVELT
jgi:hypothetical protein